MSSTKEDRKPEIECSRDGPYVVKTLEQLINSQGEEIPTKKLSHYADADRHQISHFAMELMLRSVFQAKSSLMVAGTKGRIM